MEANWIEHRRSDDGELLEWMEPVGDEFVVIDRLGRVRTHPVDWLSAEESLDDLGLSYLMDPHEVRLDDGTWLKVLIAEVSTEGIRVIKADWGNDRETELYYSVRFPVCGDELRPLHR